MRGTPARQLVVLALVAISTGATVAFASRADLNEDGFVDTQDLLVLLREWHQPADQPTATPGIPSPTGTPGPTQQMSTPTQATATHALVEVRVHDLESIEPVRGATATLVVRSIPRVQVTWNDGIALFPDIPFTQGGGQYPLEVAAQGYQTDVRSLPVLLPLVSVRVDLAPLATRTPTPTKTLTAAPTELPTPSPSPTATPTHSPTPSITSTATRTPTRTITPTATADLVRGRWTGSAESSDGNSIRTLVLVFSAQNRIDAQLSDVAGSFAFTGSYGIDALSLAAVRLFDSVRQAELSLEGTLTLDLSRIEGTLVLWAGMAEQYTFTVRRAAGQFN